jgi:hypothetical protein
MENYLRPDGLNNNCNACLSWKDCLNCGESFPQRGLWGMTCSPKCRSEYDKKIRLKKSSQSAEQKRNYRLKAKYGIGIVEFEEMLTNQNGKCAICGMDGDRGRSLCVDHCHATGMIRGLLCNGCNSGLGQFKDNANSLERAAMYLRCEME